MGRREHVIEHSAQLNALRTLPLMRTPGLGTIRLGGVMAQHESRERWERELNRNYFACGCDTGAKGLLLGLAAGVAAAALAFSRGDYGPWAAVGIALGFAVAGATAGKLAGLWAAQRRLDRTVAEIREVVQPREPRAADPITCG